MKIKVAAIGRMKAGPERDIADRLKSRAEAAGRKIGLSFDSREFAESRGSSSRLRKDEEAAALLRSRRAEIASDRARRAWPGS